MVINTHKKKLLLNVVHGFHLMNIPAVESLIGVLYTLSKPFLTHQVQLGSMPPGPYPLTCAPISSLISSGHSYVY